jgi:pimeloyl-ACP methyl ester carboxylesterase
MNRILWRMAWMVVGVVWRPVGVSAAELAPLPAPGMDAHYIEEPVFNGHAFVYEAGRGNARSIVLIHGVGDDGARDYGETIPWLVRSGFHVVTFDLPGFGRSDKANVAYTPSNYATFVKFVADKYIGGPFALLGHSMGGVVALRYTANYPRDVERLIVADVPGVLYRLSFTAQYVSHLGFGFLPAIVNPQQKLASLVRGVLGRVERTSFDPEAVLASPHLRESVLNGDPGMIAGLGLAIEDLSQAIPRIETPTLIVWGADDTTAPLRTGRLLAVTLPHAHLVLLAKTGHTPMVDSPGAFRGAIEPFLDAETPELPPPAVVAGVVHGDVRCVKKRNMVFEGEYDTLVIKDCPGARIRSARIRQLRVYDTTIEIENSVIGGGHVGLHADHATVIMTGGRIDGDTAVNALESRIDLAGVEVRGRRFAVAAPVESSVVFSISRIESPNRNGPVQGFFRVMPDKPL